MPFSKGNTLGRSNKGKHKQHKKAVYLLESLLEHGYDFEGTLVKMLKKAAEGDKRSYDMAALLVKLVPSVAHQPKSVSDNVSIDQLIINRYDKATIPLVNPPSIDADIVNEPLQHEDELSE